MHLPTLPVSLSQCVEWKSCGWVRRDQTDPDEEPHAILEGVSSNPRQNGRHGPLAGRSVSLRESKDWRGWELRGRCRMGGLRASVLKP